MAFHVGQKVVCVNGSGLIAWFGEETPNVGNTYTIREIFTLNEETGLRLEEIRNPPVEYAEGVAECGFAAWRFRPVIGRKTDISIFTDMLKPKSVKEDA